MTTSQEAQQEADCRLAYLDRVYRKTPYTTQLDRHGNYTETFSSLLYTISHSSSWFNSFPSDIFEISRLKAAQLLAASGTVSVLCNVTVEELESQKYVGRDLKLGQEDDVGQEKDVGEEENVGQEDEGREIDVELKEDECQDEDEGQGEDVELKEDECQDKDEGQEEDVDQEEDLELKEDESQDEEKGQEEDLELEEAESQDEEEGQEDPVECHGNVLSDAMTSLVNFTDVSEAVRVAVRDDVSFLSMLLRKLRDWSQPYLHGELQCSLDDRLVECGLAILSNLALRGDNLARLRDLQPLNILLPFIRSPSNRVRLLALCVLTHVATDSELQLLTFPPDIADLVQQHLTCALASNTRCWEGFSVADLRKVLQKLAQHKSTRRLLVKKGVLSLLTQCTKETEEQMQVARTTQNQVEAVITGQGQMQVARTIQNQVQAVSTGPNQLQAATDYWRSCILSYFPKLHQQTYFVPPVHFIRQAFAVALIGDQMVYVPQSPTDQLSAQKSVQSSSQINSSPASVAPSSCLPSVTSQNAASSSHSTNLATVSAPGPSSVASLATSTPVTPGFLSSGHQHLQHPHQHHSQTPQHMSVQPVAGYVWAARPSDPTPPTARVHDSESRDDHAQQHLLHCLRALSQSLAQPMVVVSQLQFGDYLNKPCYAPAAAQLPRPLTLAPKLRRGDFDILIIHSQHGLMVGEIKSVGANMADLKLALEKQEAVLLKKLVQAVSQLDKAETVLRHVVSDLVTTLTIVKTVMLPHITSGQLLQALKHSPKEGKAFRACLGATTDEEAVSYSLCADQLSSSHAPWDVTPHVLDQLTAWWRLRVVQFGHDPNLTPSVYEHLVARFCGPATTVRVWCPVPPRLGPRELRTEGEGVAETGERVAQLTLTPGQVDLLSRAPPLVFLSGPPGTGKTVVLTLMATEWLRQGHMVNVLGTHQQSRATAYLIERQLLHVLNATQPGQSHMVRRLQYDFSNLDRDEKKEAVEDLLKVAQHGQLHVIADDVNGMENFDEFCQQLVPQVTELRLWAADTLAEVTPYGLQQQQLTAPLRCPPVVVREILLSRFFADGSIEAFSDSVTVTPADGPCIKHLQHRHQPGHEQARPEDCCTCGQLVAAILQDLHVGGIGLDISSNVNTNTSTSTNCDTYPTPLMFRDVLILCENPREERREAESGALVLPAVTLACVLREKGMAVQVVETEDEAAVRELALATRDEVAVVAWETAHGLERRVVVVMGAGEGGIHNSRLYCVSRCTAQLILIDFDLNDDISEDDNETNAEPCDDDEVVSEEDVQSDE